jgi:hypothetical protein
MRIHDLKIEVLGKNFLKFLNGWRLGGLVVLKKGWQHGSLSFIVSKKEKTQTRIFFPVWVSIFD